MKDLIVQLSLTLLTVEVSVSVEYYDAMKSSSTPHIYNHQTDQDHYDYPEDHQDGSGHIEEELEPQERSFIRQSDCEIKYETVSVVKQVPSFSKHCHKVQDTKCKTIFKNAFQTQMETQCVASFDTRSG